MPLVRHVRELPVLAVVRWLLICCFSLQLHGTCLGLEALVNVISGGEQVLEQCEPSLCNAQTLL